MAVLRGQRRRSNDEDDKDHQQYEFISDLETRALEEYHLAAMASSPFIRDNGMNSNHGFDYKNDGFPQSSQTQQQERPRRRRGQNIIEYYTYVVGKDDRWGLGITLQEVIEEGDHLRRQQRQFTTSSSGLGQVTHHALIRYGLKVVGFLPDPKKIENGEIVSGISQSPAEIAGIRRDDVLIGINGAAFLLQVPLSSSFTVERQSDRYRVQKEKIILSIQKSPNPAVLHIRRRTLAPTTAMKNNSTTGNERGFTSLLDATTFEDEEDCDVGSTFVRPVVVSRGHSDQQPLKPSFSSSFLKPVLTPPPCSKSSSSLRHPLSIALAERKLIRSGEDQWRITRRLEQFTERARQWESSNSLRIVLAGGVLGGREPNSLCLVPYFDPNDLPPDMADLMVFPHDIPQDRPIEGIKPQQRNSTIEGEGEKEKRSNYRIIHEDVVGDQEVDTKSYLSAQESAEQKKMQCNPGAPCAPSTPPLALGSPLIPIEYLQAFYGNEKAEEIRSSSIYPSLAHESPYQRSFRPQQALEGQSKDQYMRNSSNMAWIPLYGIRKSLSARIVNSFVEDGGSNIDGSSNNKSRIAYTMWVYDVESGREWYAPIRYWEDFSDLRELALNLLPSSSNLYREVSNLKFPKEHTILNKSNEGWSVSVFGNRHRSSVASPMSPLQQRRRQRNNQEFIEARQVCCRLLEEFLTELLGTIYSCVPLHPNIAEIALYVQSFLGVDAGLESGTAPFSNKREFNSTSERKEGETRQLLKRSIQRYSWRIFLLHTMKAIVRDFVDAVRARGPRLQDIELIETGDEASIKARAMDELGKIQKFLDQLVDLILDGCSDDLRSIAKRREFYPIHKYLVDESYWDRLVREAVREQVEIETYVPLRSVVSRLLVNGWRHEDAEVLFKIRVRSLLQFV